MPRAREWRDKEFCERRSLHVTSTGALVFVELDRVICKISMLEALEKGLAHLHCLLPWESSLAEEVRIGSPSEAIVGASGAPSEAIEASFSSGCIT
jgi:hypothetical protein